MAHRHKDLPDPCEVTGNRWQATLEERASNASTGLTVLYLASFLLASFAVVYWLIWLAGK